MVRAVLFTLCLVTLAGCYARDIQIHTIMQYAHCRGLSSGAAWLAFEDLLKVRGAKILQGELRPLGEEIPMFVVYNGEQPGPGYGFEFKTARLNAQDELLISLAWQAPDQTPAERALSTTPCMVLGIETTRHLSRLRITLNEEDFASLTMPD